MKGVLSFLIFLGIIVLAGCQLTQGETMVLLDEKVVKVELSPSNGIGDVNPEASKSFDDKKSIKVFENTIRTAVKKQVKVGPKPDYDVIVSYGDRFPKHAIHLWLGDEDEKSTLMYMVGEGETYITSAKATNQLRDIILKD